MLTKTGNNTRIINSGHFCCCTTPAPAAVLSFRFVNHVLSPRLYNRNYKCFGGDQDAFRGHATLPFL